MIDLSFRSSRNNPTDLVTLSNRHRLLPASQTSSSMFVNASPLASNNHPIRTIQTRKPRITLQAYYDFTDIRSINLTNNPNGNGAAAMTSSSTNFSQMNPEKLMERSQELRLGRLAARPAVRPSVVSSTTTLNQQSLLWPSYNSPSLTPTRNRSPSNHIPEIFAHRVSRAHTISRTALIEQTSGHVETRHKSFSKSKANNFVKPYQRIASKSKSPYPTSRSQAIPLVPPNVIVKETSKPTPIRMYESEDEEVEEVSKLPNIDAEYEDYVEKAIVKCADWLIKYVFDQKYEDIGEY
jgi:hypothetical protein